jgi:uncharacterized protein YfbU (UPF0304 family)
MNIKSERFEMRFDASTLGRIDDWRDINHPNAPRSEAIRALVDAGLGKSGQPKFSDGEKLIAHMLCDLMKHLKVNSDMNPDFIEAVLVGGHYWALDWEYPGVYHSHQDHYPNVEEVVNVLDMWSFIEEGFLALDEPSRAKLAEDAKPFGTYVTFSGFDSQSESEHVSIARFLVEKMDRFSIFRGRDFNSHAPLRARYMAMYEVFNPIRATLWGRKLSVSELTRLLNAHSK